MPTTHHAPLLSPSTEHEASGNKTDQQRFSLLDVRRIDKGVPGAIWFRVDLFALFHSFWGMTVRNS
jgi:hypothetical protein